jgi:hypothetical protein
MSNKMGWWKDGHPIFSGTANLPCTPTALPTRSTFCSKLSYQDKTLLLFLASVKQENLHGIALSILLLASEPCMVQKFYP